MFDNFFFNNIIKKNHITFPKEWHRNIKRVSNYQVSKGLMDMRCGPITEISDFRKAMAGDIAWEDVRIYREIRKIRILKNGNKLAVFRFLRFNCSPFSCLSVFCSKTKQPEKEAKLKKIRQIQKFFRVQFSPFSYFSFFSLCPHKISKITKSQTF